MISFPASILLERGPRNHKVEDWRYSETVKPLRGWKYAGIGETLRAATAVHVLGSAQSKSPLDWSVAVAFVMRASGTTKPTDWKFINYDCKTNEVGSSHTNARGYPIDNEKIISP